MTGNGWKRKHVSKKTGKTSRGAAVAVYGIDPTFHTKKIIILSQYFRVFLVFLLSIFRTFSVISPYVFRLFSIFFPSGPISPLLLSVFLPYFFRTITVHFPYRQLSYHHRFPSVFRIFSVRPLVPIALLRTAGGDMLNNTSAAWRG